MFNGTYQIFSSLFWILTFEHDVLEEPLQNVFGSVLTSQHYHIVIQVEIGISFLVHKINPGISVSLIRTFGARDFITKVDDLFRG